MSEIVIVMVVMLVVAVPAVMYFMGYFDKAAPKPIPVQPTAVAEQPTVAAKPKKEEDPCRGYLPASPKPECLSKMWTDAGCSLPADERWAWWGKTANASKDQMIEFAKRTGCLEKEEVYTLNGDMSQFNTFMTKLNLIHGTRSDLEDAQKAGAEWCAGASIADTAGSCQYPMQVARGGCADRPGVHGFSCDTNTWASRTVLGIKPPVGVAGISFHNWSPSAYSKYSA
jgi:hypothetical protein